MHFKKIDNLFKALDVKTLYENSFPEEERTDFFGLFSDIYEGFQLYALYNNKNLVSFIHFNETDNFIHINYLAVDKALQSKGYGSYVLNWLKQEFPAKAIVLDVEIPEKNANNNNERSRRISFYKKNNFLFSNYTFNWADCLMSPMYYGNLNSKEFINYIQIIAPTITNVKQNSLLNDTLSSEK